MRYFVWILFFSLIRKDSKSPKLRDKMTAFGQRDQTQTVEASRFSRQLFADRLPVGFARAGERNLIHGYHAARKVFFV